MLDFYGFGSCRKCSILKLFAYGTNLNNKLLTKATYIIPQLTESIDSNQGF